MNRPVPGIVRIVVAGCVPLVAVGLASRPNPSLTGDEVVAWGFADQRVLILSYVGLIIGVALFGLLAPMRRNPARVEVSRHGTARLGGGAVLAVALFLPAVVGRVWPNQHLDVQLGGLQRIKDGGAPLVDAITQYGPGQQWLLVRLMDVTGFSYFGALKAQTIINAAVLVACGALFVWFLGWARGAATIGLMTFFVSPVYGVASFAGWGLLTRWFGVPLISICSAHVLFRQRGVGIERGSVGRDIDAALVGAIWAVFAVCAQETVAGGALAVVVGAGFAVACGFVTRAQAVRHVLVVSCACVAVFLALMALLVGPDRMGEALWLYLRYPQLVSNGVSNLRISEGFQPGLTLLKVVLYASPLLLLAMAAALSSGRARNAGAGPQLRRLTGVVPAALGLSVGAYLRADVAHTEGPALMIAATVVLACTDLPSVWRTSRTQIMVRTIACAVSGLLFLICLLTPSTAVPRVLTPSMARTWLSYFGNHSGGASMRAPASMPVFDVAAGVGEDDLRFVVDRYVGNGGRFEEMWEYEHAQELIETAAVLRSAAAGRSVIYYDHQSDDEAPFATATAGGVVFLSGVKSVVPYLDRSISLWMRSDYDRFAALVARSGADCLITDLPRGEDDRVVEAFLSIGPVTETTTVVRDRTLRVLCLASDREVGQVP